MAFTPIKQGITNHCFKNLCLIATDMDGTLTQQGKFTANLLQTFEDLSLAKIPLMIVTGRSAGWVSGLVSYLPVLGAIAENGGIFYSAEEPEPIVLSSIPDLETHRKQLAQVYQHLKSEFPQLQESSDNRFRLTDWTFNNCQLTITQLEHLEALCHSLGWGFTYSSVHCHIKPASQNKGTGLIEVLSNYFPQYPLKQVVTVGDSPNIEATLVCAIAIKSRNARSFGFLNYTGASSRHSDGNAQTGSGAVEKLAQVRKLQAQQELVRVGELSRLRVQQREVISARAWALELEEKSNQAWQFLGLSVLGFTTLLLLLLRQENHVSLTLTNQLIVVFPEECVAELEVLHQRMKFQQHPLWLIQLRILQEVVELLWAFYIHINFENLWVPGKNSKIDE